MLLESNRSTRGLHQELLQKNWRWTLHIEGGEGEGVEALVGEMETMNGCGVLEASFDDCHAHFQVTYFLSWLGSGCSRRSSGCLPYWLSSSPGTDNCMTGEDRGPSQGERESDNIINSGLEETKAGSLLHRCWFGYCIGPGSSAFPYWFYLKTHLRAFLLFLLAESSWNRRQPPQGDC